MHVLQRCRMCMQLLRPHCRNVEPPDPGKLQAAKAMLEAADAEAVAAEALPVGSSWPVVSLASTPLLLLPRYVLYSPRSQSILFNNGVSDVLMGFLAVPHTYVCCARRRTHA